MVGLYHILGYRTEIKQAFLKKSLSLVSQTLELDCHGSMPGAPSKYTYDLQNAN